MVRTALSIGLDAISYGMVLFIISIGLSIMMGLMRVVNLAHGAFAMIGGCLASWALTSAGLPYGLAIVVAVVGVAAAGLTGRGRNERLVDLLERAALAGRQPGVGGDGVKHRVGLRLVAGPRHAGLLVERVGRHLERVGDPLQHLLGRGAQAALDLRQVWIRDPSKLGELAHRELRQLSLLPDDLPECGCRAIRHRA